MPDLPDLPDLPDYLCIFDSAADRIDNFDIELIGMSLYSLYKWVYALVKYYWYTLVT